MATRNVALSLQVVAAQLHALQRNDWPEPDAGVRTAFAFTKPQGAEQLLPGQVCHTAPAFQSTNQVL